MPPGAQKCFLDNVFGELFVAGEAQGVAPERGGVTVVQSA